MTIDRVVVDTNVLISAVLTTAGSPALLLNELRDRRATFLFSDETFRELQDRLLRPKFDRYVGSESRHRFLAQLDAVSEFVSIAARRMGCRDPDDDKFLETALLGDADILVSGHSDLLELNPFEQIKIYRPADALAEIRR